MSTSCTGSENAYLEAVLAATATTNVPQPLALTPEHSTGSVSQRSAADGGRPAHRSTHHAAFPSRSAAGENAVKQPQRQSWLRLRRSATVVAGASAALRAPAPAISSPHGFLHLAHVQAMQKKELVTSAAPAADTHSTALDSNVDNDDTANDSTVSVLADVAFV